jgi:hypothetical protein
MQKVTSFVFAFVLVFGFAGIASADMTSVEGYYAPVNNECQDGDEAIGKHGDIGTIAYCITQEAITASEERAAARTLEVERGQTVLFKDGSRSTCSTMQPFWMNCVVDPRLVLEVI